VAVQLKPDDGSRSEPLAGHARLLQSFDADRVPGRRRPWNLNALTRAIVQELSASSRAYIRVLGTFVATSGAAREEDELQVRRERAMDRAETVRQALIQWIGPGRFDASRFEFDIIERRAETDPQIEVWSDWKPQVLSPGRLGDAPKTVPGSTLPDIGLEKVTEFGLKWGDLGVKGSEKDVFRVKLPKEVTAGTPAFGPGRAVTISVSGAIDPGELVKLGPSTPPPVGAPAPGATGHTWSAGDDRTLLLRAARGQAEAHRGITFVDTLGCEFVVPVSVVSRS
jgi:hypothetical protein